MNLFTARPYRLAAVLVLTWALTFAAAAAAPAEPGSDAKKTDSPAEKVRKALDQVTDLEISDQPLPLALAQLREQTKVNFVIDRITVANMGIDPDSSPINVKLQNVKLRTALRDMLGQYNLSYAIIGDTVHVTSEEMAMYRQLRQRVSIDLDRVQLAAALKQLARQTGTNLVMDGRVHKESQTPVSLQLEDVPLETAVRLMAEMTGLKPVRTGNVLFVTSKATAAEMRQDPDITPPQPGNPGEGGFFPVPGAPGGVIVPKVIREVQVAPIPPPPAKPDDKPPER